MAQLILLRQRIRAVETIKKITHAMQLISMSMHSRLRQQRMQLNRYYKEIAQFLNELPDIPAQFFLPAAGAKEHILLIVIGGQKGLAGNYTNSLFKFFEQEYAKLKQQSPVSIIAIGKQLLQQFEHHAIAVHKTFDTFTLTNIPMLATEILKEITSTALYTEVIVVYSYQKSFFSQKQQATKLLPMDSEIQKQKNAPDLVWEQDKKEILAKVIELKLYAALQDLLVESLSAESAARFISMQNATQNANSLLTDMKLEFNKRRQAKITLELSELAASYRSDY